MSMEELAKRKNEDLIHSSSCDLQKAAIGQRLEYGGMHQEVQHHGVANPRQ